MVRMVQSANKMVKLQKNWWHNKISPKPPSEVKIKSPGCGKLEVDDGEDGDHLIKIHFNRFHNISREGWFVFEILTKWESPQPQWRWPRPWALGKEDQGLAPTQDSKNTWNTKSVLEIKEFRLQSCCWKGTSIWIGLCYVAAATPWVEYFGRKKLALSFL